MSAMFEIWKVLKEFWMFIVTDLKKPQEEWSPSAALYQNAISYKLVTMKNIGDRLSLNVNRLNDHPNRNKK